METDSVDRTHFVLCLKLLANFLQKSIKAKLDFQSKLFLLQSCYILKTKHCCQRVKYSDFPPPPLQVASQRPSLFPFLYLVALTISEDIKEPDLFLFLLLNWDGSKNEKSLAVEHCDITPYIAWCHFLFLFYNPFH